MTGRVALIGRRELLLPGVDESGHVDGGAKREHPAQPITLTTRFAVSSADPGTFESM
jgi:hypothetical protein